MKSRNFFAGIGLLAIGSMLVTSCVQKNYYDTNPHNNNNNNTTYQTSFDEEFNGTDYYGWGFTSATDSAYASITNGSYQYVNYGTRYSNLSVISTGINTVGNFTVKTSVKSNNKMGLIFGGSSLNDGYAFFVDTMGNYALYQEGNSTTLSTAIIPFTFSSYVIKNGWNSLEVDQTNGSWTGYINGTQVFSMAARSISGDKFGYKVLPGTVGYADYLQINSY